MSEALPTWWEPVFRRMQFPGKRRVVNRMRFPAGSERELSVGRSSRMCLDLSDGLQRLLWFTHYEALETDFLLSQLHPGRLFVDVGANVGWFTVAAADHLRDSSPILALEPAPQNFASLCKNVEINGFRSVTCMQAAASDHEGEAPFLLPDWGVNSGWGHLLSPTESACGHRVAQVHVATLDSTIQARFGSTPVGAIKVDTEGLDYLVLSGAMDIIRRDRPAIMVELGHSPDHPPAEFVDLLAPLGYWVCLAGGKPLPTLLKSGSRLFTGFFLPCS